MSLRALSIMVFVLAGMVRAQAASGEVARGRYLATLGDCDVCHTAPHPSSQPFAGGYALHADVGTVYSSNITPDRATGIGSWSKDQFYRAMHDGIAADGHHLYPAFPYVYFTRLSRADSDALYAYLRTVKPVHHVLPSNKLIFPANIRFGMTFWNWLFLDRAPLKPDPSKPALWNRGAWLVNGLGHCGGCHTPKTVLFTDKTGRYLQGDTIDGWFAPNLTGSKRTGLGAWSTADIEAYLKTGANRFGRVVGAMRDVVRVSTSRMSDGDRAAIAAYLKSLPAAPEPSTRAPDAASMQLGQTVFVERCSSCHSADTRSYPSLAGNSVAQQPDPTTLIHVILQGAQAVATPGKPIGYSMPAFPVLSDRELAAVATYVRNAWGNRAGPVTTAEAGQIRKRLSD